jgi:hypothetical protein
VGDAVGVRLVLQPGDLVRPVTIPSLARQNGVPRRTLFRQLLAMHRTDAVERPEHALWLFRDAAGGPWRVNMARFRAAHPERFNVPPPEEMHAQLLEVDARGRALQKQVNALVAAFREHRRDHERG